MRAGGDRRSYSGEMLGGVYRELPVPLGLAAVVEAVWVREVSAADSGAHRIVPDGCTDLMWVDGELLVAGPDTVA